MVRALFKFKRMIMKQADRNSSGKITRAWLLDP